MKTHLFARASAFPMLRGPAVALSPDEEGAEGESTESGGEGGEDLNAGAGDDDTGGEGTESGGSTESSDGGDETVTAGSGDDHIEEPKKRVPWQVKRIDQLTGKAKTLEEENQRIREENAALKALAESGGTGEPPKTLSDTEINTRAQAIADAKVLNDKVNAIYDGQLAKDPKMAERILTVRAAVGDQLGGAQGVNFFQALTSIDNAGEVFSSLTKDVDHLAEILEMPPIQMGIELAKLSSKAAPKDPAISNAGKNPPPKTIQSASITDLALDDPNLPQAEYSKRRAAEREARRANGG